MSATGPVTPDDLSAADAEVRAAKARAGAFGTEDTEEARAARAELVLADERYAGLARLFTMQQQARQGVRLL